MRGFDEEVNDLGEGVLEGEKSGKFRWKRKIPNLICKSTWRGIWKFLKVVQERFSKEFPKLTCFPKSL